MAGQLSSGKETQFAFAKLPLTAVNAVSTFYVWEKELCRGKECEVFTNEIKKKILYVLGLASFFTPVRLPFV